MNLQSIHLFKTLLIALLILLLFETSIGQIVTVGAGSYTTQFPGVDAAGRNTFPTGTPFTMGPAATKPVPTNDWWSAKIKNSHADNLFNYPYTLKTVNSGLVVSYMPWGVIDDLLPITVGVTGLNAGASKVVDFSDWTVTMDWSNGAHHFQATAGIGMPFLYFSKDPADIAQITVTEGSVDISGELLIITDAHYGADFAVYAPASSEWIQNGNTYTSTLNGQNYWSMAFLPLDASSVNEVANEYKKYAYVFPSNTEVSWDYDSSTSVLSTDFVVETEVKEGSDSTLLLGLLPHQWANLAPGSPFPDQYSYATIRGELKTLDGNSFSVDHTFHGILPTLPYLDYYSDRFDPQQLHDKVTLLENDGLSTWTDSYNEGQMMNRLIQTARIADLMGNTTARDKLFNTVKNRLENWLSANTSEIAFLFYYNNTWSAMIGYPAGHGQDGNINDHHFHWGYFIHAAAFVEQMEPGWVDQWGPMVNLLVRDAASDNRDDELFPFLRNFSPYAGHCWANGFASFPQGNDQESTSESMQFNSSLIHWGSITGNDAIRDLGIYLYTTEQSAIEEYWFDVHDRIFSPSQQYRLVSRLWGNSYDNGTFWTNDIAASYGIELYPIHGGSLYLGQDTTYIEKLWNEIETNTGILSNEANNNLWHDILWEYLAFINPEKAIDLYDSYPDRSLKFGVSDAQTYHWLHSMNVLGHVDISLTADHPLAAVFRKNGELIYVAHNYQNTPISVTFSDDYILEVPANSMATSLDISLNGILTSSFQEAYPGGSVELNLLVSGGEPSKIEFLEGEGLIGQITEAPYVFEATNLDIGVHTFYARIYDGSNLSVSNLISVVVGEQLPYLKEPIAIPGSFEAANYDIFEGGIGQGISYSDVSPGNNGDFRPDEHVDAALDVSEGGYVGWIATGEWLEYTIEVQQAGNYSLDFRYASGNQSGGGPFRIESDGEIVHSNITVNYTGNWDIWASKTVNTIPLKSGTQVLRLFFENGELNLGNLTFTYESPLTYDQPVADAGENMLVQLPETSTVLDGSGSMDPGGADLSYSWTQIYGPSNLVFSDPEISQPTVSSLVEGVYVVKLTVSNGSYSDDDEVYIVSSIDTNIPPEVSILSPADQAKLFAGHPITVSATVSDLAGFVTEVEFYADNQLIGTDIESPYEVDWSPSPGDYSLTAIAIDNDGSSTTSEAVHVTILPAPDLEGTWKMDAQAFSLGVGPVLGDLSWWSCNSACVSVRACYFDDAYVFEAGGVFNNVPGTKTWIESWQDGAPEGCRAPIAPHDGSNPATWSLAGNTLTLTGVGAYLGLAKVNNTGELSTPGDAPAAITYPVTFNAGGDTMTVDINYGSGFWHFVLVKVQPTSAHDLEENRFSIYPNPVTNILNLELAGGENEVTVYNLTGSLINRFTVSGEYGRYDMSNLNSGLYIFKVANDGQLKAFRVIKE